MFDIEAYWSQIASPGLAISFPRLGQTFGAPARE